MKKSEPLKSWFPGLLVAAAALIVYFATASRAFYPLESAGYLAAHLGRWPFPPLSHPLWGACVKMLNLLPGGAVLFNIFNSVCAALSAMLLFLLANRLTYRGLPERYRDPPAIRRGQLISALTAAAVLACSIPFWFTATRAHPLGLDILLLLGLFWMLARFHEQPSRIRLLIFSLVWGLAVTEYSTVILLSLAVIPLLSMILWREKMLNFKTVAPAFLCFLLGLSVYLLQAALYVRHPAFGWQELEGFFQVLWFIWREQYVELKMSTGANGWIVILISMLVPALALFPNTRPGSRTVKFQWTHFLLYLSFAVLAAVILFSIYPSPWAMVQFRPLMVLPYAVCALWMGYLAGLFYAVIASRQKENSRFVSSLKKVCGPLFVAALAAALAAAAVLNHAVVETRPGDRVADMAAGMVRALDSRQWLITDGTLEANFRLEAAEQGAPVNLVNIRMTGKKGYLNYVASLFSAPRLQSLARVGMVALLKEWLQYDDASVDQVAVATDSEVWRFMGRDSLPDCGIFKGTLDTSAIHAEDYFARQKAFWEKARRDFSADISPKNVAAPYWKWARSHISKVANNSGVLLHDLNRPDLAAQAYREARQIDTNNISALLNLHALAAAEKLPDSEEIKRELEAYIKNLQGKLRPDRVAAQYGLIRDPRLFVQQGIMMAAVGQPGAALYEMEKVAAQGPVSTDLQMLMASMYTAGDQPDRSAAEYKSILEREPDNPRALAAMVQLSLQQRNPDVAEKYLDALSAVTNVNPLAVLYQRALVDVTRGKMDDAILKLQDLFRRDPDNLQAAVALMLLAQSANRPEVADEIMGVLAVRVKTEPRLALSMAIVELQRQNYKLARGYLESYNRSFPRDMTALDMLLRLDTFERRKNKVEEHVEKILSINPRHSLANYLLGTLQLARGELSLAENSFRTSLASQETPEALNDLAWILYERGRCEEALSLSYRSLELNDHSASSWDTYAMVLLCLDKLLEAEEAISMAMGLQPANPVFLYHYALVLEKQGDLKQARLTAQPLLDRAAELPPDTFEGIRELLMRLPQ